MMPAVPKRRPCFEGSNTRITKIYKGIILDGAILGCKMMQADRQRHTKTYVLGTKIYVFDEKYNFL